MIEIMEGDVLEFGENSPNLNHVGKKVLALGDFERVGDEYVTGKVRELWGDFKEGDYHLVERWQRCIKIIGKNDLYVGTRVRISPDSPFYTDLPENPGGVGGVITHYVAVVDLPFTVTWDNGHSNTYGYEDLDLVDGAKKGEKKKSAPRPKVSLTRQINEAVRILNGYEPDATASYIVLVKDMLPTERVNNTACHQGLRGRGKGSPMIVSCVARGIDNWPWFYKWLIDESPWSSAFFRRYAWSKKNKVVAVRTDLAANFVFGACFATRIWEQPAHADLLDRLRKHFDLSFIYPHLRQIYLPKQGEDKYHITHGEGAHWPFAYSPKKEVVKNFMAGTPVELEEPYNVSGTCGYTVSSTFGDRIPCRRLHRKFKKHPLRVVKKGRWDQEIEFLDGFENLVKFFKEVEEEFK